MLKSIGSVIAAIGLMVSAPASAQATVEVQPLRAELDCSRLIVAYWGLWMIDECRNNFQALAARVGSAIQESGRLTLSNPRGRGAPTYRLSGSVTELGVNRSGFAEQDSSQDVSSAVGAFDFRLIDVRTGQVVLARTVTRTVEMGGVTSARGVTGYNANNAQAVYTEIQRQIGLDVARSVAFHVDPLRLTYVEGRDIGLNYGSPLIEMGSMIQVSSGRGRAARYRVIDVTPTGAVAEAIGAERATDLTNLVNVVDDPVMQNARRNRRVELP